MSEVNSQLSLKKKLLAECMRRQRDTVDTVRRAMQEAQASALEYDENPEDNMVDSYREEMQNKRDMFARQMEKAMEELALLSKVNTDKSSDEVMFGSVVVTEMQKMFIGISLGQIPIEEGTYFAISPSAPIYKAIVGKKKGETFFFNGKTLTLKEVI